MRSRRNFIKNAVLGSAGVIAAQSLHGENFSTGKGIELPSNDGLLSNKQFETPGIFKGMPIHATFLDEVSWDIPHQNWGVHEWDRDFQAMKAIGINTVVMIRSGLGWWIASF